MDTATIPGGNAEPDERVVTDSGLIGLILIARFHGIAVDADQLRHQLAVIGRPFTRQDLLLAARSIGLKARAVSRDPQNLRSTPLPALACCTDGRFVVLAGVSDQEVLVQQGDVQRPLILPLAEFLDQWDGTLLLFASRASLSGDLARFDFTWFIPAVVKYRRLLAEVLVSSITLQVLALATPLFFQVVMDKVLVHQGLTTLDVVAAGLLGVSVFEVLLSALRTYVFSHTTSRIDVELGARLFRHLLQLPLAYFQARRVGDSVARVRELENIRQFLTGNAITVVLDLAFSFLFITVMFYYSVGLTLLVLASLPAYAALSLATTPLLRSRLQEKFQRGAENQAFLIESVNGVDTLKSMALEPQMVRQWDKQLAAYVAAAFRASTIASVAHEGVNLVGKLVTVAILWLGARLVINGELTVGQLVAFNMLAGRVAQPVTRLAQLWTDFQQTGISMQRLGDILNASREVQDGGSGTLPRLTGSIRFGDVRFRYRPNAPEVLRGIDLDVAPGEVIGIVGRSGSGKSTLTRLLQRLYHPDSGRIWVDGIDLGTIDPSALRRQIGVVLQESMLFNRSVRDNIAIADPGLPLAAVIEAARLAGAHDFIAELPQGYDTIVGEHGATLSGGQRQRLAIARALIGNPRILIFDEATSALDYESERAIQANMKAICHDRTVLIVAHRLSALRTANRIIVIDRGQIVEAGSHAELLAHEAGHFSRLHRMQTA